MGQHDAIWDASCKRRALFGSLTDPRPPWLIESVGGVVCSDVSEQVASDLANKVQGRSSLPDDKMPRPDMLERMDNVLNDPVRALRPVGSCADTPVIQCREAQAAYRDQIAQKHGTVKDAPESVRRGYIAAFKKYQNRLIKVCNVEFQKERAAYLEHKARGETLDYPTTVPEESSSNDEDISDTSILETEGVR